MPVAVNVREWDELVLPAEYNSAVWRERIYRAGETEIGDVFRLQRRRLFARDLVGLLQVADLQIQILPKILDPQPGSFDLVPLLEFLSSCGVNFPAVILRAKTSASKNPLIEQLVDHVASALIRHLAEGPPRRYSPIEENDVTVRGRILISKLQSRRPGTQHLLPLRYHPLQVDNLLSRLIKATAIAVRDSSTNIRSRRTLTHVIEELSGVATQRLSSKMVDNVQLGRFEQEWKWLVDFAGSFARSYTPEVFRSGNRSPFSMLFPLDGLFEVMVRRTFRECLLEESIEILPRAATAVLLVNESGAPVTHVKPDLLFIDSKNQQPIAVGDAKWKNLEIGRSGPVPRDSDVYQLLSYLQLYSAERGFLVFPAAGRLQSVVDVHMLRVLPDNKALYCIELDVLKLLEKDPQTMNKHRKDLGKRLADLLTAP